MDLLLSYAAFKSCQNDRDSVFSEEVRCCRNRFGVFFVNKIGSVQENRTEARFDEKMFGVPKNVAGMRCSKLNLRTSEEV